MNREGLNQELGVVEQAVATEAAELAAMEVELADIEHCCLHGQPVPPARAYRIKVDNQYTSGPRPISPGTRCSIWRAATVTSCSRSSKTSGTESRS